jgi:hypothetical protein
VDRPGPSLLLALRDTLSAGEVEAVLRGFAAFGGADHSTDALRAACGPVIDPTLPAHRAALLAWLRAWGCRHLRVQDTRRSSDALRRWWAIASADLPSPEAPLTELTEAQLLGVGRAYVALARRKAATRASGRGDVAVTFGDTAASKALYALRPLAVPPWDAPMRAAFGTPHADEEGFAAYLSGSREALLGLSARLRLPVDELPVALGRPRSSPARLVDEFLWMRITHDR